MRNLNRWIGLALGAGLTVSLGIAPVSATVPGTAEADRQLLDAVLAEDDLEFGRAMEEGADVNAIVGDWEDEWAMCAATQPGKERFLKALLDNGAHPDLVHPTDTAVSLPTVCSMVNGNIAAFDILIEGGADPHLYGSGTTSLFRTSLHLRNFDIGVRFLELLEPSHDDLLYVKKLVERTSTLQSPETRALAAYVEARGIDINLTATDD